jgi:thioesterase domain-containing protein
MAADYLHEIRSIQPTGPYHLLGYSLGGNIAHEIANQLQEQGQQTDLLALLDAYPMTEDNQSVPTEKDLFAGILDFAGCPSVDLDSEMLTLANVVESIRRSDSPFAAELEGQHVAALMEIYVNSNRLAGRFSPRAYRGNLLFFSAAQHRTNSVEAWRRYVREINNYDIDCVHDEMTDPTPLAHIGQILTEALDELSRTSRSQ